MHDSRVITQTGLTAKQNQPTVPNSVKATTTGNEQATMTPRAPDTQIKNIGKQVATVLVEVMADEILGNATILKKISRQKRCQR